jgi:hypothetical protein
MSVDLNQARNPTRTANCMRQIKRAHVAWNIKGRGRVAGLPPDEAGCVAELEAGCGAESGKSTATRRQLRRREGEFIIDTMPDALSDEQRSTLYRNGFVVVPGRADNSRGRPAQCSNSGPLRTPSRTPRIFLSR